MSSFSKPCPFSEVVSKSLRSRTIPGATRVPPTAGYAVQCCDHAASGTTSERVRALLADGVIGIPGVRCGGDLARCALTVEEFAQDPRAVVEDHPGSGERT